MHFINKKRITGKGVEERYAKVDEQERGWWSLPVDLKKNNIINRNFA